MIPKIAAIATGSFGKKEPPAIRGGGHVVHCLEAALWTFDRGGDFTDVVLRAASLGDDADTTAAVAGQLAGAYYGIKGIPAAWSAKVAMRSEIERLADQLAELAQGK